MTEAELLAGAQRGDGDAYAELVAPHRRALHVHCYRMLGSVHDAEDAVQETLLRAWRGLPRFEGRGSLRSCPKDPPAGVDRRRSASSWACIVMHAIIRA
jgi:RNA polymerase sigma-70 factor, ECF subfamily